MIPKGRLLIRFNGHGDRTYDLSFGRVILDIDRSGSNVDDGKITGAKFFERTV